MVSKENKLKNGEVLLIKEVQKKDAAQVLEYIDKVAGETDFLRFGPGEFNMSLEDEEKFIETVPGDAEVGDVAVDGDNADGRAGR